MATKSRKKPKKRAKRAVVSADAIRATAAVDYADRLLEIRGEPPLNPFERDMLSSFDHARMVETIADLALLVPRSDVFPTEPDMANALCWVPSDVPDVEEVCEDAPVRSWIPNARTRAAIEEARSITLYKSARRHRLEAGA